MDRVLWLGLALSMPLFGVLIGRITITDPLIFQMQIPLILLVIIGAVAWLRQSQVGVFYTRNTTPKLAPLNIIIWLFILWHLINIGRSIDFLVALREVIKLIIAIGTFYVVVFFCPRNPKLIERFWQITFWSSAVFLIGLIYFYAFIFHAGFLGVHTEAETASNRNLLSWYLTLIFPYAMTCSFWSKNRKPAFIPLSIFVLAMIYIGSRMAWVATFLAVLAIALLAGGQEAKKRFLKITVLATAVFLASLLGLNELANVAGTEGDLSYQSRFQDLLSLGSDQRYSSIEIRMELNRENWQYFLSSPLIGIGYMNSSVRNLYGLVNHNDWLLLLADTGIVGFGLFAAILGWISLQAWRLRGHDWWVTHGNLGALVGIITSLFFIDAYTTVFLWVILAMILVSAETEQLADANRYVMSQNLVWSHAGQQL